MMLSMPGSAISVGFITSMRERVMFWSKMGLGLLGKLYRDRGFV